jgi:DNA-binding CsgD family transcriptional regulator
MNKDKKDTWMRKIAAHTGAADTSAVIRLLQTKCNQRLGIDCATFHALQRAYGFLSDETARLMDKREFQNEKRVQGCCKMLGMTEDQLREHVKDPAPAGLTRYLAGELRGIFDMNVKDLFVERQREKGEAAVKEVCARLHIGVEELKRRLEYLCVDDDPNKSTLMRETLGVKFDRIRYRMATRGISTISREKRLIALWHEGKTYEEIALAMKCSIGSAIQHVNRLRKRGIDMPKRQPYGWVRPEGYTPENIGRRMRNGESISDIARSFGKEDKIQSFHALVYGWRKRHPDLIPYVREVEGEQI